jgi:hydrogenase expression/formation protein HypE
MTKTNYPNLQGPVCPLPLEPGGQIVIGHGSGGGMTRDLIVNVFQKYLGNAILNSGNDSALLYGELVAPPGYQLVVSTDAHVVFPLFFPGSDIGSLSVCGTVNDVAMLGAQPKYLTASFILEEALRLTSWRKFLHPCAMPAPKRMSAYRRGYQGH